MTQGKHTPWSVGSHPWPEQIGCCPLVGRPFSVHGTNHHNVAAAVSEDIARLIAAAPDMLEALRPILQHAQARCVDAPEWTDKDAVTCILTVGELRAVSAAIARATGEKP